MVDVLITNIMHTEMIGPYHVISGKAQESRQDIKRLTSQKRPVGT